METLRHNTGVSAALTGITASVAGVIANLAFSFAEHTLFEQTFACAWAAVHRAGPRARHGQPGCAGHHDCGAGHDVRAEKAAPECGLVRIPSPSVEPLVTREVFERLRAPAMAGEMVLATTGWQDGFDSLETWWMAADEIARRQVLDLLLDHVVVLPAGPKAAPGVERRLSLAWRNGS